MSSPWAKIAKPEAVNLEEIMSEEVARDLQAKEEKKFWEVHDEGKQEEAGGSYIPDEIPDEVLKAISNDSLDNDAMIAQMLQMQFDKEYDEMLKKTESKYNGTSKVSVCFDNYRRAPQNFDFESDLEEDEIEDIADRKDWDRYDSVMRDINSMPVCGYKVKANGEVVTKHDLINNGRKNACKLLSFPPEFQTGDGEDFDLKLSNKVYNSLRLHSKKEQVRQHRAHDKKEDHATAVFGLDERTRMFLYKMVNAQLLERVNGIISIGKEALILHAESDPSWPNATEPIPKYCAIKIFKTTRSEFKHRDKYIKDDHRFKNKVGNQNSNKVVHLWAEKELANLMRLKKAGICCPQVVSLLKHVLVMSFIGQDQIPAPKLKDACLSEAEAIMAFDQIVQSMQDLYHKANLIHADLSEYNILWHEDKCWFIDVSQSVEPSHENAFHFLYRDCTNIVNFFNKKGVPQLMSPDELFTAITGCSFSDRMALMALREIAKIKPHMVDHIEPYGFDHAWDRTQDPDFKKLPKIDLETNLVEPPQA